MQKVAFSLLSLCQYYLLMFKSLTLPSKTLLLGVAIVVLAASPKTYL